jgi:hypothetical protein
MLPRRRLAPLALGLAALPGGVRAQTARERIEANVQAVLPRLQADNLTRVLGASARAVLIRSFSAKSVRSILQSGLDQQPVQKTLYAETPMPEHENVRGPKYYH